MRYLFGFLCVCALSLVLMAGCGDTYVTVNCGGTAGSGGSPEDMGGVFACTEQGILDAIAEGGGPHTFDCVGPTTVTTSNVILIDNDVILDGRGNLSVDGDGGHNVFLVAEGTTAELRSFVVTNGAGQGGGVFNLGNLMVKDSTVSGNSGCSFCSGGGIRNEGTLALANSTVSGNNSETGAGIHNDNLATATVTNSTVSGNTGGGLYNDGGTLTVTNSTVSGNTGDSGIRNGAGASLTLGNTLIDDDCDDQGDTVSLGYNIESPGNTCGFDQEGDQAGVSAVALDLQPLADNGGPTMTHAITTGSAAFNAGTCEVTTDQRGVDRPQGAACDVGAFELEVGP